MFKMVMTQNIQIKKTLKKKVNLIDLCNFSGSKNVLCSSLCATASSVFKSMKM